MDPPKLSQNVEEKLEILKCTADLLGIDDLSFPSYSASITRLSTESMSLRRSLNSLQMVEDEMRYHLASAQHERSLINKWKNSFEEEERNIESVATLDRRREMLLRKAKEYHKELEALLQNMPDAPPVTVSQLTAQQEKMQSMEQEMKVKRVKIKAFHGLPPNLELARNELRDARDEQMKLIQLRERLLGRMAESVA